MIRARTGELRHVLESVQCHTPTVVRFELGTRSKLDAAGTKAGLRWRTLSHYRPRRLLWRLWRFVSDRIVDPPTAWSASVSTGQSGWPAAFSPLDSTHPPEVATAEDLRQLRIRLLGEEIDIGGGNWVQESYPMLVRYHLHYWEWAWSLAAIDDEQRANLLERMWRSWEKIALAGNSSVIWVPYVVSLRAWALMGLWRWTRPKSAFRSDLECSLKTHLEFLSRSIEFEAGGNHLIKNIKALIGLGIFLRDDNAITRGLRLLDGQLRAQILADGGHFERSPGYHIQVLSDLIDLDGLLSAAGRPCRRLPAAIRAMRNWTQIMDAAYGPVPALKDGRSVDAEKLERLGVPRGGGRGVEDTLFYLKPSGYVAISRSTDEVHVRCILDVGPPGADSLPAHGHADTLSFILEVNGAPIVMDTGVSTYAPGSRREYERSTYAHSTVVVGGLNSSEVWGSFRVGEQARTFIQEMERNNKRFVVSAYHDGYNRRMGVMHLRSWCFDEHSLTITDRLCGSSRGLPATASMIVPELSEAVSDVAFNIGEVGVTTSVPGQLRECEVAKDIGVVRSAKRIDCQFVGGEVTETQFEFGKNK